MKIKLAVPDNPKFERLFNNISFLSDKKNIEIYKVSEEQCHKLLLGKQVDAALISPLGYSMGVKTANLRIIPAAAMTAVGFTGLASVFFREGTENITSAVSDSPDDFLLKISPVLLSEKYGLNVDLKKTKDSFENMLDENDVAVVWRESKALEHGLDISDEWFDLYEMPLPLMFWTCWEDNYPADIKEIIDKIADPQLPNEEIIHEKADNAVDFDLREGRIFWSWTDEVSSALEQTIQFLYFNQLTEEIGAVKILGRD